MHPAPAARFKERALGHLPARLYAFNLADFKRRNMHLGRVQGDLDIALFERLFAELLPAAPMMRVGGDRWLALVRSGEHPVVEAFLDRYAESTPLLVGWELDAARDGSTLGRRETLVTTIARAVRCLFAPVETPRDLDEAVLFIEANDYSLPVQCALSFDAVASMERAPWSAVAAYPASRPACPFCEVRLLEWHDGDGSIYTGAGVCKRCGAEVDVRDVSEPCPGLTPPDATRPFPGSDRSVRIPVLEELGFERIVSLSHHRLAIAEIDGHRVLVTVLAGAIGARHSALRSRGDLDLPLLALRLAWNSPDAPSVLVELLPRGFPSTRFAPGSRVPPFVVALAGKFAAAHAEGAIVGELHPHLVFVDDAGTLTGIAQRPLRAEHAARARAAQTSSGGDPLVFTRYLSPRAIASAGDAEDDASDDVFRFATMLWRWRHGSSPFGSDLLTHMQQMLRAEVVTQPRDDLDRLFLRALSPKPGERPSAAELQSALASWDAPWRSAPDSPLDAPARCPPRLVRARADADAMAQFLQEQVSQGSCSRAALHLETTITWDAADETVETSGVVFGLKADGAGDCYRFGGSKETLMGSFARRVVASRSAPDRRAIDVLREAMRVATPDAFVVGEGVDPRSIVSRVVAALEPRIAMARRHDARATSSHVAIRWRWQYFWEPGTKTERSEAGLFVRIDHALDARSAPTRLYGEELSAADLLDHAGAERTFFAEPTLGDLDALIAAAARAKPW